MNEKPRLSALVESIVADYDMVRFSQRDADALAEAVFQAYMEAAEEDEDLDVDQLASRIRNERSPQRQEETEDPDAEAERYRSERASRRQNDDSKPSPEGDGDTRTPTENEREAVMKRFFLIIDGLEQDMLKLQKIERLAASKLK